MKHAKKKSGRARPDTTSGTGAGIAAPPVSGARRRLFVLMALALPVLLLGLLEAGLRLGGYGYDPAFFKIEHDASGREFLGNNDSFMFRFFPPERARWPGPFKLAVEKPAEVQRIFIFGESAAMGDPQPSVGTAHILEVLLRERFPQQRFEVVNLGITAINSHVILPIARDVAERGQGDLWLVYMGNNEMVGPFGAATVFGTRAAPLSMVRLNLALQKFRVGQLAVSLLHRVGGHSNNPSWGGMEMFLQNQVSPDDVRRETVYENFAHNLRDIVAAGRGGGAKIVLSTVSVNLRDCPPFASLTNPQSPASNRKLFAERYTNALQLQTNQQPSDAMVLFSEAARLEPKFAEVHFRWAQCLLSASNLSAARDHFQLACDVDALPFRADTRINSAIRLVGRELAGPDLSLCDAEVAIAAANSAGIAGDGDFFEHVHFNFDGNYRLAKVWAEHVARLLPERVTRSAKGDWANQEFCERAIGLSDWNRGLVISSVLARMNLPPLANQFNNAARAQALQRELRNLAIQVRQTNAVPRTQAEFQTALAQSPNDAFLRANYATFLGAIGDQKAALTEFLKIMEALPNDFHAALQAGRLLGQAGNLPEAERLLRRATAQRPTLPDAWFELGLVLAAKSAFREALNCFDQVARLHPSDPSCLIYQSRMLSKLNRRIEAMQNYRKALTLDPDNWQAHLELAEELVVANEADEAIKEYLAAVRLNPRHAVMRVNLGVMLTRQNRVDEAIQQFEAALRLDPTNVAASDYLRQVAARHNQGPR